jgi:glycosyltransferase involved in cell wall biosynthesis
VNVGVNAQLLSYRSSYRSAGISRYIDRTLAALAKERDGHRFVAFVEPGTPKDTLSLGWLEAVAARLPTDRPFVRIAWEQLVFPRLIRRYHLDVVHSPAYVTPLASTVPSVVTFHDLSFFALPVAFNRTNRWYLQTFSRLSARRANRLIAVSEFTRREMQRVLGVRPERVDVVPNGVDGEFRRLRPEDVRSFRSRHSLPDRFVLYLGTLEPRKNVPALIRAYAVARQRGVTAPLVLAGGRGWGELELERLIARLGLSADVRMVGFVPAADQPLWYTAATLFAFLSRYEGFGLPVLEAMACGTPCIASNLGSLPEVVGDGGVLVDPDDDQAVGAVLATLLGDDAWRDDLATRGQERARRFTWDGAARATMDSYRQAIGRR